MTRQETIRAFIQDLQDPTKEYGDKEGPIGNLTKILQSIDTMLNASREAVLAKTKKKAKEKTDELKTAPPGAVRLLFRGNGHYDLLFKKK
jgi:hypothetical protein